ncbi:MAG: hypothetical protein JWR44_340, partial [Hymenobacter sp.]|nr:hypothetical protein [Hymenobacter sp.]
RALYLAQQKDLLWKRQISESTFIRSYRYYGIHGKDLSEIYQSVIDTLQRRAAVLDPKAAKVNASLDARYRQGAR